MLCGNNKMTEKTPAEVLNELIAQYPTAKEFARKINEDTTDVLRWRHGRAMMSTRAVVSVCRLHPKVKPHQLNPKWFPVDLTFKFGAKK
jgi:hypothetical protein